ncbi:hypothetical protein GJ496_010706 [Pomphorhynchus laevis]|nr:hypothetical protein GJ496_010706 [Pomphorhynchus laevis]
MQAADPDLYPFIIAGFIIAFALAFGIGANDVANSFGTSVGSKVLTLRQACILASIFEILGAILIGGKVSATIREGIIDPQLFHGKEKEYCLGLVTTLAGCCIWMLLATFFKLPVSGTHSIVGSTMGFALVCRGSAAIHWYRFAKIVASWFISPLLSGFISVITYLFISKYILADPNTSFNRTLQWLPFFYCVTILINVLSVLLSGPSLFYFDRIPLWSKLLIVSLVGIITIVVVRFCFRPQLLNSVKGSNRLLNKTQYASSCNDPEKKKKLIDRDQDNNVSKQEEIKDNLHDKLNDQEEIKDHVHDKSNDQEDADNLKDNTRIFTIERPKISKDAEVQVDYIALLSDYPVPAGRAILPFFHTGQFHSAGGDYPYNTRRTYTEPDRGYSTYRQSFERYRPMPRIILSRNPSDVYPMDIAMLHTDKDVATVMSSIDAQTRRSPIDRNTVRKLLSSSAIVTSDDDDSESDEISERVHYIDAVKSQMKRDDEITDSAEIGKLFSFLQIMTAVFGSFAHGGNDVSNAIGPLISLWLVFAEGTVQSTKSPLWVLFYGGVGIIMGLWIWGRRVIKTIEVSTAFTVLFASNLSIPVSTTHCKVGSVVFTGRVRSKQSVDWSLFGNIIIAWLVTVPVTGIISAALTALFRNSVISG